MGRRREYSELEGSAVQPCRFRILDYKGSTYRRTFLSTRLFTCTLCGGLLGTWHHKDFDVYGSFLCLCSVKLVLMEKRIQKMFTPNREKDKHSLLSDLSCSTSLVVFPLKKTPDWPSGPCTKTHILGAMLSDLMEVALSVTHSSLLLSFSLKMEWSSGLIGWAKTMRLMGKLMVSPPFISFSITGAQLLFLLLCGDSSSNAGQTWWNSCSSMAERTAENQLNSLFRFTLRGNRSSVTKQLLCSFKHIKVSVEARRFWGPGACPWVHSRTMNCCCRLFWDSRFHLEPTGSGSYFHSQSLRQIVVPAVFVI